MLEIGEVKYIRITVSKEDFTIPHHVMKWLCENLTLVVFDYKGLLYGLTEQSLDQSMVRVRHYEGRQVLQQAAKFADGQQIQLPNLPTVPRGIFTRRYSLEEVTNHINQLGSYSPDTNSDSDNEPLQSP